MWRYSLKRLFGSVGVVLISQHSLEKGAWKLGKTNFGLYLGQKLKEYGIIHEMASNVNTKGVLPQVSDLFNLKHWLFRNPYTKAYMLDEANIHAPRRRAMSNKNIGILEIFPEISKARARLFVVCQDIEGIDKDIKKAKWIRGYFLKTKLKKVQLVSNLLDRPYTFSGIPKTTIPYNPYEIAPFTERPRAEIMFKDKDLQKLHRWANGATWREEFEHPNECNRFVRRMTRKLLEKTFTDSLDK